jgi:hypothetical protein
MANPHSREFPPCQRLPLVISSFSDDTDSRTVSALSPPWPLNAADFMDLQLRELAQLNCRLDKLGNGLDQMVAACLNGSMPIDRFTAVCLIRLRSEVYELARHADPVAPSNWRRWLQMNARRQPEERQKLPK